MLYIGLGISILINILLLWFVYKLLRKSLSHLENIEFLIDDFDDFVRHLESIYELEMFYGEETLKGLLGHSRQLKEEVNIFKENYLLELEEDKEEEEVYEQEEEDKAPTERE